MGILFALGAGSCWALYIVAGQKPSGVSGNHTVSGMFVGMLVLMPIAFAGMPAHVLSQQPHVFCYFGCTCQCLTLYLEMIALRNLTALSFGTLMSLEPAVAALSGFVF